MANGGVFTTGAEVIPTKDEVRVSNLQWIGTFTVDPVTDILTTSVPHEQVAGAVVMVSSTGVLPTPLPSLQLLRVCTPGFGASTMEVAYNAGWNPPPENTPIDITDVGVGVHHLWIRSLDFCRTVGAIGGNYLTGEVAGGGGAIYFHTGQRHQYKNIVSIPGLPASTDLFAGGYLQTPITKWTPGAIISGSGQADLWTYDYTAIMEWGLGDLGVIGAGGDRYYSLCGECAFGPPPPSPGGGGGEGREKEPMPVDRQVKIQYQDQDITNLVRRAERASSIVENLRIVGQGVSGGAGQWQINPD